MATEAAPALDAQQKAADDVAPPPADVEAPPAAAPLAPIIVKKIAAGHGGAHGGAWKIALADMMTAMMAFFLLMWILGATNDSQRKSVADYFKPTSHSQIAMGALAGSNGILGGRSIIDPDGFPYTAKQTAAMERLTPRSEGGPTENDPSPNSENARDNDAKTQKQAEGQGGDQSSDKSNFDQLEKEVKEQLAANPALDQVKNQVQFVRDKEGLRMASSRVELTAAIRSLKGRSCLETPLMVLSALEVLRWMRSSSQFLRKVSSKSGDGALWSAVTKV